MTQKLQLHKRLGNGVRCAGGNKCSRKVKFFMGWRSGNNHLYMGMVCGVHDRYHAAENLARAYGLSKGQARSFDWDLDRKATNEAVRDKRAAKITALDKPD
jgi:hypothetical protein